MKAWKKAAILGLVCAGILVSPSIMKLVQESQEPADEPPAVVGNLTQVEHDALEGYAHKMLSKSSVIDSVAIDFQALVYEGTYGISAEGYLVGVDSPLAAVIVEQHVVTFTCFEPDAVLTSSNAIIDGVHECVIFVFGGQYRALVIVG